MTDSEIIDKLGGTAKLAAICEVSMAAISQWRSDGIPKSRRMFLKLLHPDAFAKSKRTRRSVPPP